MVSIRYWEGTFRKGEEMAHLRVSSTERPKCPLKVHSDSNSILILQEMSKQVHYILCSCLSAK